MKNKNDKLILEAKRERERDRGIKKKFFSVCINRIKEKFI